jgi:hypothetical protein
MAQPHRGVTVIAGIQQTCHTYGVGVCGDNQIYRYCMPTAFKRYFMPTAFNPDGVFSPWQVSPPATENMPMALFFS